MNTNIDTENLIQRLFTAIYNGENQPLEILINKLELQPDSFELHYIAAKFYKFLFAERGCLDELNISELIAAEKNISAAEQRNLMNKIDKIFTVKKNQSINLASNKKEFFITNYIKSVINNSDNEIDKTRILCGYYLFNRNLLEFDKTAVKYEQMRPKSKRIKLYRLIAFFIKNNLIPEFIVRFLKFRLLLIKC